MIIGNKRRFGIELVPVTPSWESRYAPEKAAWAGTAIWVDDKNLCSHRTPGSSVVTEYLYIPLGPLVDWLVHAFPAIEFQERAPAFSTSRALHHSLDEWFERRPPAGHTEDDWLDAREDWWRRHFLRAGADGALLPDLALCRSDEQLVLDWATPQFVGADAPIMLCPEGQFNLPWNEGRAVLEELASTVAKWFRWSDATHVYPWAGAQNPLSELSPGIDETLALFAGRSLSELESIFSVHGLSALLGKLRLDPQSRDPAASPHCQMLRDLSPGIGADLGHVLAELGDEATRERADLLARWGSARQIALDAARSADSPERAGQLAASEIRHALSLDGQPIPDVRNTLEALGLLYDHAPEVTGGADRMMVAARNGGAAVAKTVRTVSTEKSWGQRFEAARALGHILLDPMRAGALGAASGPFAEATRRRRSGAFAAEFLLPEHALAKASGGRLDGATFGSAFEDLLAQYGVGATTAANQLFNRGWLSSIDVRDELVEMYGAVMPN